MSAVIFARVSRPLHCAVSDLARRRRLSVSRLAAAVLLREVQADGPAAAELADAARREKEDDSDAR